MTNTKDFFEEREDWSRRKHLVLQYYLKPAVAKMSTQSSQRRVVVVDAFAGTGQYGDGSPGSPILLARLARQCSTWQQPAKLDVYCLEPDDQNRSQLLDSISRQGYSNLVHVLPLTFSSAVNQILDFAGSDPLYLFLDPFAPKPLPFDDIVHLFRRPGITEALVVFHTPAIKRVVTAIRSSNTASNTRDTTQQTLISILGQNGANEVSTQNDLSPSYIASLFSKQLASATKTMVYTHAIEAKYGENLKYHVVFATRNDHGVLLMNEAIVKEQRDSYSQLGSTQTSMFAELSPAVELSPEELRKRIIASVITAATSSDQAVFTRRMLILMTMKNSFGVFSETEIRQTIQAIVDQADGKLKPITPCKVRAGKMLMNDETLLQLRS